MAGTNLAHSSQVKLCQQRWNENLSSWPLFLNTMLETACVVVSVCVFPLRCLCGKMCSLAILFYFFPDDQTQFFNRSQPLPSLNTSYSCFSHFSSFEYDSNFLHPYASKNRIGCLYSSPFLLFPSL